MSEVPAAVLARYGSLAGKASRPFGTGLINDTFVVDGADGAAVVQRLHPVFSPRVHEDIAAVTARLRERGVVTPELLRADDGSLWVQHPRDDGTDGVWRAMSFVEGSHTWDKVPSREVAREAGAMVGRWHAALGEMEHDYVAKRGRPHDTARHVGVLKQALDEHRGHRLYADVSRAAGELLPVAEALPDFSAAPTRHAHGDLKISNVLFDARDRGLCLVDLDTVGRMVWPHEMGDALRSWCNPAGEDATEVAVDVALFEASVEGYAETIGEAITGAEWAQLVAGFEAICAELAARFLADALRERYFGWDAKRYATRGEHNLVRGVGQWRLAQSVARERDALRAIVARAR